jgi:hypothetical protein
VPRPPRDRAQDSTRYGPSKALGLYSEKNKEWSGRYIEVTAAKSRDADRAWVIEIETADSVSATEARNQWKDYDNAYATRWYLAVLVDSKDEAQRLLRDHNISNCSVITWRRDPNGTHTFWGLPGLDWRRDTTRSNS